MPIGGTKVGLFGAGVAEGNYFGDESLGNCQFGASAITQTGDSTAIDTVLATGSESGGPGTSSYGRVNSPPQAGGVPNPTACYEVTVLNKSGSYDGDMVVLNFIDLTIDASVTLTTDQPCRGMLVYCSGDVIVNGILSMTCRGAFANPSQSGGSDSSAVSATGLRLPLFTASGTDTLAAADFAGCGNAVVAAVANQPGIGGDGSIFAMSRTGANGAAAGPPGGGGSAGPFGANTITSGGGASGRGNDGDGYSGTGGDGTVFAGGSASGSTRHGTSQAGNDYGGAGTAGVASVGGEGVAGGGGNPGGAGIHGAQSGGDGNGGIIWLVVKGDITIGASGSVQGHSSPGGSASHYGGSTPGGGAVFALYAGSATNVVVNGTIDAQGGGGGSANKAGHAGGRGGTQKATISE